MIALRIALAVLVAAAMAPELSRYAAERRLHQASARLQSIVAARPPAVVDRATAAALAAATARGAAASLPGDWRPLNIAGSAWLIARQPAQALEEYRAALARGERPEVVVNLGRAYASLGRQDLAAAAFLRAAWISPAVLTGLPAAARDALSPRLTALERDLTAGRLAAPPPPPD